MKLTISELSQLNELILSCTNTITCMALFRHQIEDPELKALLDAHFPLHVNDYNRKVEFVKNSETASGKLNVPEMNTNLFDLTNATEKGATSVEINVNAKRFNDREIATSYLLTLKRAGREYAFASMEATNPKLRQFLKDAYTMSCNHAYEVWEWMANHGFYPLNFATKEQQEKVANMFDIIQL